MTSSIHARRARFCLIVHEDRASEPAVEEARKLAEERGVALDTMVAKPGTDGALLARTASASNYDAVIAAGGDGTLNAVVNGLAGTSTPLGIIPIGTANDFASQAGIPDDPREALELILSNEPITIDTGSLNGRQFINVSTGGIGAETTAETPEELKDALGPLAYAITGIRKLTSLDPMQLTVSSPGKRLVCEALAFAVGNGRSTGGGNLITPRAELQDGLLDVCIVESRPVRSLLALLPKIRGGEHIAEKGVHYFRTPAVTITSAAPVSVNLDGEPLVTDTMDYRAHSLNLSVLVRTLPGAK